MLIDAKGMDFSALNDAIRGYDEIEITNCLGQRFIASGMSNKTITIHGTPGNALGAYLDSAQITVLANAQDAVGDTMNDGRIIIHGNCGDTVGYAMRGGEIYVKGDAGYRAGIHMKAYKDKLPVIVIGGCCGSFLGEYQAGGKIIVLGLHEGVAQVGNFCGTGMHGGEMYIRCENPDFNLPSQVRIRKADENDLLSIKKYIDNYCTYFEADKDEIYSGSFYVLTPDSGNPYKQLYVKN